MSAYSFFQTNTEGAEQLYSIVREFAGDVENKMVFDLYCGTGTIGQIMAMVDELTDKPDVIIVDPPREGIHPKAIGKIIDFGAPEIVYVSCKPTSLARDLQEFQAAGYEVKRVRLMDMFPRTVHVESVVLMTRCGTQA